MKKKLFYIGVLALVGALIFSGTVFADGELPPQETPVEEPWVASEPAAPVEEMLPAKEEEIQPPSAVEEALPVEEQTVLVEEPQAAAEPVLVDGTGEPIVLASQESVETITNGDPRWKVGTQWYSVVDDELNCYPGTSVAALTCFVETGDYITFALDKMTETGLPTDRKLYVETGIYTEDVTIDSSRSLLNGLIGVDGSGLTTINGNVSITNNINGFTLQGFTINGGVSITNSVGALVLDDLNVNNPNGIGIQVGENPPGGPITYQTGTVTIQNVTSSNNQTAAAHIFATSAIKVLDSEFNDNNIGQIGGVENVLLYVKPTIANVIVTVTNVTASGNKGHGLRVTNELGKAVLNNVTAENNLWVGILLEAFKGASLNQATANDNGGDGIYIYSPLGPVFINGALTERNVRYGVTIEAKGATLKNIVTSDNGSDGLYTYMRSGAAVLENISSRNNSGYGLNLQAYTTSPYTLKSVIAYNNGADGIYIETKGAVKMTTIQTELNTGKGAHIIAAGLVTINTIRAAFNGQEGLLVEGVPVKYLDTSFNEHIVGINCPTLVTITSPKSAALANYFGHNGSNGLAIYTNKAVALNNFAAYANNDVGVYVDGITYEVWDVEGGYWDTVYKNAGAVTVGSTIPNYRNTSDWNEMFGMAIYSDSTVKVENTSVSFNQLHGMDVQTKNTITVKNVKANDNFGGGAIFMNSDALTPKPITLTNVEFNRNVVDWGGTGVDLHSRGAITIKTMTASGNGASGAAMQNEGSGLGRGNITLTDVTLNDNGYVGLEAYSNGTITLKNVEGSFNGDYGFYLKNDINGFTAGINLYDVTANENQNTGISANTDGNLKVVSAIANGNARRIGTAWGYASVQDYFNSNLGVDRWYFDADESTEYVMLLKTSLSDNLWDIDPYLTLYDEDGNQVTVGVVVDNVTNDYVSLTWTPGFGEDGLYYLEAGASDDGFYRLSINDPTPSDSTTYYWVSGLDYAAAGNVSITGSNTFNDNSLIGIYGWSEKAVVISNLEVQRNGTEGVNIQNLGNFTLSGDNVISDNGWEGLYIDTGGAVAVSNLEATDNGFDGISIYANTLGKAVTLKNILLLYNGSNGLSLDSNGVTTLNNVCSFFNNESGARVDTHEYKLIALNSVFMRNTGYGMVVRVYPSPFVFLYSTSLFFANGDLNLKMLY